MSYFKPNYTRINYPIGTTSSVGLRNAQLGAIHAIASHFTLYQNEPALVVMPTGSGKTAIITLSGYLMRAKRILVISSTILVRGQIVEEFSQLKTLKKLNVFHRDLDPPKVYEAKGPIKNKAEWDEIAKHEVLVGIPNSILEGINNHNPGDDFFDLILVDEAHHTPASTWEKTINAFPKAKKIYFTATPFRRDGKEVLGKIAYNYPLTKAYEDKIFGEVGFIPVFPKVGENQDLIIAKKTEEIFNQDRTSGLEHFLLIRTDRKDHADVLEKLYQKETSLRVKKIHSRLSYSTIQKTIKDLKAKKLDGIITVNMLGEGFDFPNLKIAAIHAPHKSLANTLQFIGRFARTTVSKIGPAKFIAIESDIVIGNQKLYKEDKVWNDIIQNLSATRIKQEDDTKEVLDTYSLSDETKSSYIEQISLYNLTPYRHVKIYRVQDFILEGELEISGHDTVQHFISESTNSIVFITKEKTKPKWLKSDELVNVKHHLFFIFYDKSAGLLFIHSSIKTPAFYDEVVENFTNYDALKIPKSQIHKVLLGLSDTRIFNMGLQSKALASGESYITKAGPNTENTVTASDGRMYSNGHIFGTAKEQGELVTIGYSSGAKVWSQGYEQLPKYIEWCKELGKKINSKKVVKTNSGLDNIPVPKVITKLEQDTFPFLAVFNELVYKEDIFIFIIDEDELLFQIPIIEFDITLIQNECTQDNIVFELTSENATLKLKYSFDSGYEIIEDKNLNYDIGYSAGGNNDSLIDFFNEYPFSFNLSDFSILTNNNELQESGIYEDLPFDQDRITAFDWGSHNCDIKNEFTHDPASGKETIHNVLAKVLKGNNYEVLIYDHGTGETADFISVKETTDEIIVELYHVKGSGGDAPGDRVNDLYEVCGQCIKSLIWTQSNSIFLKKISTRTKGKPEKFLLGDYQSMETILSQNKILKFSVIAVQPGISNDTLTAKLATLLAATDDFIRKNGKQEKLKIIGS